MNENIIEKMHYIEWIAEHMEFKIVFLKLSNTEWVNEENN